MPLHVHVYHTQAIPLKVQMQTLRDTFIDFIHIAYVESIYNNENLCEVLKLYFTFLYMCPPGPDSVYRTASTLGHVPPG